MNVKIKQMLAELNRGLAVLYAERLRGTYLFGSYARGDGDEESDVDVLIVLDEVEDYAAEVKRTSHLVSELSLKYGRSISCVYASREKWENDQTLFFLNLREEAVPA